MGSEMCIRDSVKFVQRAAVVDGALLLAAHRRHSYSYSDSISIILILILIFIYSISISYAALSVRKRTTNPAFSPWVKE